MRAFSDKHRFKGAEVFSFPAYLSRVSVGSQSQKWDLVAIGKRNAVALRRKIHQCRSVYPTELLSTELSCIKDNRVRP